MPDPKLGFLSVLWDAYGVFCRRQFLVKVSILLYVLDEW